jgi:ferritin
MNKKIEKAFNDQINAELYSGYLYLAMAGHFLDQNLNGFATWLKMQAMEELYHAMKFYNFIDERNGRLNLLPVEGPPNEWKSALAAFQDAYKHEQYITGRINKLMKLARDENDFAAESFLKWFVDEQVEEEANADEVVQQLKLVGDSGQGLFLLDRELGMRTFVAPPDFAGGGGGGAA